MSVFGGSDVGDLRRAQFGTEAEEIGTRLDKATDEFIQETKGCRALQIPPGQEQLTAMEFVDYLGINLAIEPELAWIAREMLAAPMPYNAERKVSKAGVLYFRDVQNDYYTIEHPLTQRYLKVLERQRLDLLAVRTKPSMDGLLFSQPDMIFHQQFRNLQIPCQSCGVMQSQLKCNQCLMSFCHACYDALHKEAKGPRKDHTTLATAHGSVCSTCAVKKPQVFCANCEDYFCFPCFEDMHRRGNRLQHKSTLVAVSDGEVIERQKKCEECDNNPAAFACDYCLDNFCVQCFWKCHFNGFRRKHTASKICVTPLCNQCTAVRATVFCEQCQELMCTECFTHVHSKGNRMLHLFMDAMDLLVLLEKLDPGFQEHMRRARPRVLWAISKLQGWTKGIESRWEFKRQKFLITEIQRRWRGCRTRMRLLGHLHMHKWRRRQVNTYFLPKTAEERRAVKQKCAAMLAAKEVTHRAANASLEELQKTIMQTAASNPHEDMYHTRETLEDAVGQTAGTMAEPVAREDRDATGGSGIPALPAAFAGGTLTAFGGYDQNTRFGDPAITAGPEQSANVATRDVRRQRESTLRQATGLDMPPPPS